MTTQRTDAGRNGRQWKMTRADAVLDRSLPKDIDVERGCLGSILLDGARLAEVAAIVGPDDFFAERHQKLFGHLVGMRAVGILPDLTLILDRLRQSGDLQEIGGEEAIAELMHGVAVTAHAAMYATVVKRKAQQRAIIAAAEEARLKAYDDSADPGVLAAELRVKLDERVVGRQSGYRRLTCAELDAGSYELEFLIDRTLVAKQPCIVAGGKKCLKTSLILDMGISLAVGGFFLGKLKVSRRCRVGIMTGESGLATIQETCRRICRAAGHHLADVQGLFFSEDLPQFGNLQHEDALRRFIKADALEVLVIDPAYLCLPGADAGNLFVQGDLLRGMTKVCGDTGCTMVLAHHTRKTKVDPFAPPELEDIAWAGFQEFARQWLLVGRREAYEPGTGEHRLWLSVGGSAGHTALWAVDVSEGTRDDLGGRRWEVQVSAASEARAESRERRNREREEGRQTKQAEQLDGDRREIVAALVKLSGPETKRIIRDLTACGHRRFDTAFATLVAESTLKTAIVKKANGQEYEGWVVTDENKT